MPGPVIPNPTPDWLKPENASVTDTALTKAMRMIGHLIGADNPTAQVLGLMMTDVPGGSATGGLAKAVEGLKARVIKAYHGSPHDFERFSLEKIGTGEGAQAYGHGLYFAENENVARGYQANLAPKPAVSVAGREIPLPPTAFSGQSAEQIVANRISLQKKAALQLGWADDTATHQMVMDRVEADINSALDGAVQRGDEKVRQSLARQRAEFGLMKEQGVKVGPAGRMYEVAIHADPEDFLDWDKPLSQQSEKVKQALAPKLQRLAAIANDEVKDKILTGTAKGSDLHHWLAGEEHIASGFKTPPPVAVSNVLREAGIPGIKYYDSGSRTAAGQFSSASRAGEDLTRNYVVNDDRLIDILKKYGLLLPAAGGAGQATIARRSE